MVKTEILTLHMLKIDQVSFSYGASTVIKNFSFECLQGSHVAIIGESGSGKSTLLKLLYGYYDLNEGEISLDGSPILGPKYNLIPGDDRIKYLAQDFGLMPYITAGENVGQFLSNTNKAGKQQRIRELLDMVGMLDFIDVNPKILSGGQQQRVALARVLALAPQVLLLDEPFSQIDTFRANQLRRSVFSYVRDNQITCFVATHDSSDVLSFADEVIVMKEGKIVITGRPEKIYKDPKSHYVASLFDEVTEISASHFDHSVKGKLLLYPHQLQKAEKGLQVSVTNSYFKGTHFLIEALHQEGKVLFNHTAEIAKGTLVSIMLAG